MFYMLYMVTSLKHEVARLESRRLALAVKQLERKRFGCRDDSLRAVGGNQRFDRAVALGEPKKRPS